MDLKEVKKVKLEVEFLDGKKSSCYIYPESIQGMLAYHDISILDESLISLIEQKENGI
jgi:hypothetical protein